MSRADRLRYKSEHRHDQPRRKLSGFVRFGLLVTATMFLGAGITTLLKGHSSYPNWWGGPVFAPVGIVLGVLLMVFALQRNKSAHR